MYRQFYRLNKSPFHITPDPEFLFLSGSHKEASASIVYGIEQRKGFIAITGEVGVGKTTILRSYLESTDPEKIKIVYIFNCAVTFQKLLKQICIELGISIEDEDASELVNRLSHFLIEEYKNDRNVVLIVDEAQNMPVETLEQLRMLSNLETSRDKLIQMILVGQPEFDRKLEIPELRQLKQRIAIRCRINPLSIEESLAYINHRLMSASSFFNPIFTKEALKEIIRESGGIPRVINVLCDNSLVTGFGYQRSPVDKSIVKEVIADMKGSISPGYSFKWRTALSVGVILIIGLVLLFFHDRLIPATIPQATAEIPSGQSQTADNGKPGPRMSAIEKEVAEKGRTETPSGKAASQPDTSLNMADKSPGKEPGAESGSDKPEASTTSLVDQSTASEAIVEMRPVENKGEADTYSARIDGNLDSIHPEGGENLPPARLDTDIESSETAKVIQKRNSSALKVKKGDTLFKLMVDVYGRVDLSLVDSFREANPHIRNLDKLRVGEEILLPQAEAISLPEGNAKKNLSEFRMRHE